MVDNKNLIEKSKTYTTKNELVDYFLVLIFTVFPLFYTSQYTNIRHDKLFFFLASGITLIFIEGAILLYNIFTDKQQQIPPEKKWYQKLSGSDYAFTIMILTCTISTVFSKYPFDAILGTQGRNNGLLLLWVYFGIYIIISRLYIHKEYIPPLFAISCIIVFLLCILNFFYIDPLGIFKNYNQRIIRDFTSTIGNKNLMASFCCITTPVFLMLYMHIEKSIKYLFLLSSAIGFVSLICANSECGFLGFVPTLVIILIYASKSYKILFRFFNGVAVMLLCGKILGLIKNVITHKRFGSIQKFFLNNNIVYLIIIACICLAVFFYFRINSNPPKVLFYILLFGFIACLIIAIFLFFYFTFIDTKAKLGPVTKYLRFSEKWGTHRGFIWIKSVEIFKNANLKDKLLGCGPDNYFSAFYPYFEELEKFGDSSTNCAHNELLNYLVTIGFVGTASYITLIISVITRAFNHGKTNFLAVIFASSVICYFLQSFVNIAQPITTPLFFIFIALTEAINKQAENSKSLLQ